MCNFIQFVCSMFFFTLSRLGDGACSHLKRKSHVNAVLFNCWRIYSVSSFEFDGLCERRTYDVVMIASDQNAFNFFKV